MNKRLYATTALLCLASAVPAFAQEVINTPILTGADNFRDIAGVAPIYGGSGLSYTTSNGGAMRTGVFYRTNALSSLTAADKAALSTLNITELVDLRTPGEISGAPEAQNAPAGATYVNVNVFGAAGPPIPSLNSAASSEAYLEQLNREFVTNPVDRANLATAFADLANTPGAGAFNCSSGKDRTGWVAAMLQSIAGVSQADIMANYLATNAYSASYINGIATAVYNAEVGTQGVAAATANSQAIAAILSVQQPDLQAGLDQIVASYGTLDNYLIQGLGMSQAEIYVLRAKMVEYAMLPGQAGMTGNAAAGAALLNALQNSPLSGSYTSYNYYLQSAIDAGSLGGVQNQVGGQVVADAMSSFSRLPSQTNNAIAPYISGIGLSAGQTTIWEANLAGVLSTASSNNAASTTSRDQGLMIGVTHRIGNQISVDGGVGYDWGTVGTAGGSSQANTVLTTIGMRYGFSSLDTGPYVAFSGNADVVTKLHESRTLGGGLGTSYGNSNGAIYAAHAEIGNVIPSGAVVFTPSVGIDVVHASLQGFTEQGGGIPLAFNEMNQTTPSIEANIQAAMPGGHVGTWQISPTASLGYVRLLSSPVVSSRGVIYGNVITQHSAFNSRDLGTLSLDVSAQRGAFAIDAGVTGVQGDGANSTGAAGNVTFSYKF